MVDYVNVLILNNVAFRTALLSKGRIVITRGLATLVPRATLRGVAELHVTSGMSQWRIFGTCCYF